MKHGHVILTVALVVVMLPGCSKQSTEPDIGESDNPTIEDFGPDSEDATETDAALEIEEHVLIQRRSPGIAYHEHNLGELEEGVALNQEDTVLVWLEHPDSPTLLGDTGSLAGQDSLGFRYFEPHDHIFCWSEAPTGAPHTMTLEDENGKNFLTLTEGEGCKTVPLEPGLYTQHFIHGGDDPDDPDGELIFIQPAPLEPKKHGQGVLRKSICLQTRSTGIPCQPVATLTHGTIGQLKKGQVGITNTCTPVAATPVWVYDNDCANLYAGQGWPKIDIKAIYTGPNTQAIVHRAAYFTGYSVVAGNTGSKPVCTTNARFVQDFWTSPYYSLKVWENEPSKPDDSCVVKWVGRSDEIPWSNPAEGEVWLFSNPGWNRSGNNTDSAKAQITFILGGPCNDLCRINASETITSAKIGPNTVMTTYLDPDYLGQSFPYQGDVYTFGADNGLIESIFVENLAQYNSRTTLIRTKNCNQCNLIGLRLRDGENLSGAQLVGANLTSARMIGVDLSNSNATGAVFRDANLAYSNLRDATLSNAIFEGDSRLGPANLSYAYMPNAKLDHAHMNGVVADYAQIYGSRATVLQATMVGIHLANATLSNMDFSQAAMKTATLTGANLISANFLGADLSSANLVNASLQGATFDGAKLYGAHLQNSAFAFEPGLMTVTRLGDDNTLQTVSISYGATSLPPDTTNRDTYCPNGGRSDDGNEYCDSVLELTAPSPPSPPTCVPSATQFCPRPGK